MRPIRTVILDFLGDVVGGDVFGTLQISYGARDFEDAGVGVAVGVERPRVSQPAVIQAIVRGYRFVRQKELQLVPQ